MKRKKNLLSTIAACFLFGLLTFGANAYAAERTIALSKQYDWKMASIFPKGHTENIVLLDFIQKLEQRTNGKVKITIHESTLGHPKNYWEMTEGNAVQFSLLAEAFNSGRMVVGCLLNLPFEIPGMKAQDEVVEAWLKAGYLRELTDHFKVFNLCTPEPMYFFTTANNKIEKLEDFKGKKIRAASRITGQIVTSLGATGVSIPGGETYMALQTGGLDGTTAAITMVYDLKWYEQLKNVLKLPVSVSNVLFLCAMNLPTWNGLPDELKTLMEETAKEAKDTHLKIRINSYEESWKKMSKVGVNINTISNQEFERIKNATKIVAEEYVKTNSGKGPVREALKLMREIAARNSK